MLSYKLQKYILFILDLTETKCDKKSQFKCGKDSSSVGGHEKCISLGAVCDGTNDCGDWSDEISDMCKNNITSNNVDGCHLDNGGCDQVRVAGTM